MARTNVYLNFPGTAEAAFNHYKKTFGGDFAMVSRFSDTPEAGNVSGEDGNKIMHIALPLDGGSILMASDVVGKWAEDHKAGNNVSISVDAGSKEEADRIYNSLSEGGKAGMPMGDTFWGAYFGMCTDQWGIHWMVNYDPRPMGGGQ